MAANPKLVGVRHVLQDEPDDRFMLRPEFLRGIGRLAEHELAYDLLIFPRHLPVAVDLVRRFPLQKFVLDHIAKPPIREGLLSPWQGDLRRLADHPDAAGKLSRLVPDAAWKSWRPEDLQRDLYVGVGALLTSRFMICPDWPVCKPPGDSA